MVLGIKQAIATIFASCNAITNLPNVLGLRQGRSLLLQGHGRQDGALDAAGPLSYQRVRIVGLRND